MRLNKHLTVFTGLTISLSIIVFITLKKCLPLLLQQTVYYCQTYFNIPLISIPLFLRTAVVFVISAISILTIFNLIVLLRQKNKIKKQLKIVVQPSSSLLNLLKRLELTQNVFIVKNQKPFAICFGIYRPRIYLSTTTLTLCTKKELAAILLHEKAHLKNSDTLTMTIAACAQIIFPFFPLFTDLVRNYQIEREIIADRAVTNELGIDPLISILKKLLMMPTKNVVFVSAIASEETLEPRIHFLTKGTYRYKQFKGMNILISLLSLIILCIATITPVKAVEIQNNGQESSITMVCLQQQSCFSYCKNFPASNYSHSGKNYTATKPYPSYTPIKMIY